ncbi:MAG: SecY family transport protein, partial [Flavobacteriales bacterium]
CCTLFIMWLGEKITDKGIGNGISIIIMIGIIAGFPRAILEEWGAGNPFFFLVEIAAFFLIIVASVALVQAVRRVPVHFAKSNFASGELPKGEQARSFIPLKVNSSGVMPIIFAQAIMFVPLYMSQSEFFQGSEWIASLSNFNGIWYNVIFALMIIIFTYFYTAITVNVNQISDDMKRNGSFVPGIKPGRPTSEYLDEILSRITLPGSVFLALIAVMPAIVAKENLGLTNSQNFAIFFGGTSLLIMVGVILDTLQQIESHLLSRHYDGLMQSGTLKGRTGMPVSGITG